MVCLPGRRERSHLSDKDPVPGTFDLAGRYTLEETGEKQAFRSFMELVLLMTSALESSDGRILYEDKYLHKNRESALMEG